jgi:hypothetical protein
MFRYRSEWYKNPIKKHSGVNRYTTALLSQEVKHDVSSTTGVYGGDYAAVIVGSHGCGPGSRQ